LSNRGGKPEVEMRARDQRERHRELGWCLALAIVLALAAVSVYPVFAAAGQQWWLPVIVLAVGLLVAVKRRRAGAILPSALILLGFCWLPLARYYAFGPAYRYGWWGPVPVPGQLVLAEAYAFLLLGGWLAWRQLWRHPAAARLVLGRTAGRSEAGQPWGLLLLPAVIAVASLATSDYSGFWAPLTVLLLAGSMLVIRRSPELAARLAVAGLILLGLAGLAVAIGAQRALRFGDPSGYPLLGAVIVSSEVMVGLAVGQAVGLLGLGCWLVPRAFPEIRSLASAAELTRRVQRLTESREVAVDTAAAELRRLERDLHDGAQARLVAVGMSLRAAERLIPTSPDAALALVAEARETSARALTELRELVRGVHPPVLADRGLADAIRALALDCPLTVETDIDVPGRLPAPVETACYFAVAELLTNVAKHSGSAVARVSAEHAGGLLRIAVTDFGLGGADPVRGTGLAGVERRLAAFDGVVAVNSPVGGPTIVAIELPAVLSPCA
jgi:signal transduction histidine kinase